MTATEIKTILLLAGIYTTRMLGLFLIFPTFSLLAQDLNNATPDKIGWALGIYSLAQAVLQIPAGWLSDLIGRKKVLYLGLSLFLLGSIMAALTDDLDVLIIARLLQGMGAVSAVSLAYIGDSIRGSQQGKAMMIIGMAIGFSFMLAFILGPLISRFWGLSGIFYVTALLALSAIGFVYFLPTAPQTLGRFKGKTLIDTLCSRPLFAVNSQVGLLHMILSACFFLIPILLGTSDDEVERNLATLYVIPLLITAVVIAPLVRDRDRGVARLSIFWLVLMVALGLLGAFPVFESDTAFIIVMTVFFCGFTLVETLLPARLLQFSDPANRGASSGVFSLYQLGGNFLGALFGAKCYAIFAVNDTIQTTFYILAFVAALAAVTNTFTHHQQQKVSHGKQRH